MQLFMSTCKYCQYNIRCRKPVDVRLTITALGTDCHSPDVSLSPKSHRMVGISSTLGQHICSTLLRMIQMNLFAVREACSSTPTLLGKYSVCTKNSRNLDSERLFLKTSRRFEPFSAQTRWAPTFCSEKEIGSNSTNIYYNITSTLMDCCC